LISTTNALYFSRAPIPWVRDRNAPVHARHLKHLGLYSFRRAALLDFPTLPLGDLERIEQLEQLRWMETATKFESRKRRTIPSAWTFRGCHSRRATASQINVSVTTASFLSCVVNEKR